MPLHDDFDQTLAAHWKPYLQGAGRLEFGDSTVRLIIKDARAGVYADAQLDDYTCPAQAQPPAGRRPSARGQCQGHHPPRRTWLWRPPLSMQVRARASSAALVGTAGFGFWNDPFAWMGGVAALPQAVWFFYASPPSNMALVPGVPGWGWKAAIVNTTLARVLLCGAPTAAAVLWTRLAGHLKIASSPRPGGRPNREDVVGERISKCALTGSALAQRWVQRISGAREALLPLDGTAWHTFELDWQRDAATFRVDGERVLHALHPPRGPLGFVAWVDNQFAVATPRGDFRFGTLDAPGQQWLELDWVHIQQQPRVPSVSRVPSVP